MLRTFLAVSSLLLALGLNSARATQHRGVWFWQENGSPFGVSNIIGNSLLETQTVHFLQNKFVRRVYGSYGQQPVTNAGVIAGWNARLQGAGIQSQFLMSENTWIFPTNHAGFLMKISERVLDFNNAPGRTAAQKFDGLHLDIEPQALPGWSALTPTEKRDHLFLLRDTYAAVRQHLTNEGAPSFPVYADLPVWFDRLPVDGGSVGWSGAAERDQWYADIAVSLDGITLMAFDTASFNTISNNVSWERANATGLDVRVGLEADIGAGLTWTNVPHFNSMMETLEAAFGPGDAVDIQSYTLWREALASLPLLPVTATLRKIQPLAGEIGFEAETNWTYLIHYSLDLCAWQEVLRVSPAQPGPVRFPARFSDREGYWRVTRFQ